MSGNTQPKSDLHEKHPVRMTAYSDVDFDKHLTELMAAVQEILTTHKSINTMEELYRSAYIMVTHKHGEIVYNRLKCEILQYLQTKVREKVVAYLNSNLIPTITRVWGIYISAVGIIRDIFMYLERVYVAQNNKDGIMTFGTILFRDEIVQFPSIKERLTETLVELVVQDFRQELSEGETSAIKEICGMLTDLDAKDNSVYEEVFEEPFLAKCARFYEIEGNKYLEDMNVRMYIKQCEHRMQADLNRAKFNLNKSTEEKLLKLMEEELITKKIMLLIEMENGGVANILIHGKEEEFDHLRNFLGRVPGGGHALGDYITRYLSEQADPNLPTYDGNNVIWQ